MTAVERRAPRRKSRRAKRTVLMLIALAWAAGCTVVLIRVFSTIQAKCAACIDCAGTAP